MLKKLVPSKREAGFVALGFLVAEQIDVLGVLWAVV